MAFLYTRGLYVFQLISIILTVLAINNWTVVLLKVNSNEMQRDFIYGTLTQDEEIILFSFIQELIVAYENYWRVQGINSIFIVMGIIPYLRCSIHFSFVVTITTLSKRSILTYLVVFLIIVGGFSIAGFMLYGDSIEAYSSILRSFLEMELSLISGIDYNRLRDINPATTPLFVFSYLLFAYLIFLKTLLVILQEDTNDFLEAYRKLNKSLIDILLIYFQSVVRTTKSSIMKHTSTKLILKNKRAKKKGSCLGCRIFFVKIKIYFLRIIYRIARKFIKVFEPGVRFNVLDVNKLKVSNVKGTQHLDQYIYLRHRGLRESDIVRDIQQGQYQKYYSMRYLLMNLTEYERSRGAHLNNPSVWLKILDKSIQSNGPSKVCLAKKDNLNIFSQLEKKILFNFASMARLLNFMDCYDITLQDEAPDVAILALKRLKRRAKRMAFLGLSLIQKKKSLRKKTILKKEDSRDMSYSNLRDSNFEHGQSGLHSLPAEDAESPQQLEALGQSFLPDKDRSETSKKDLDMSERAKKDPIWFGKKLEDKDADLEGCIWINIVILLQLSKIIFQQVVQTMSKKSQQVKKYKQTKNINFTFLMKKTIKQINKTMAFEAIEMFNSEDLELIAKLWHGIDQRLRRKIWALKSPLMGPYIRSIIMDSVGKLFSNQDSPFQMVLRSTNSFRSQNICIFCLRRPRKA